MRTAMLFVKTVVSDISLDQVAVQPDRAIGQRLTAAAVFSKQNTADVTSIASSHLAFTVHAGEQCNDAITELFLVWIFSSSLIIGYNSLNDATRDEDGRGCDSYELTLSFYGSAVRGPKTAQFARSADQRMSFRNLRQPSSLV
ncbi:uncharacterized protein MELLADRAFT_111108 [Melampsora larici-populina 98AG31]|uniref:Uncharacterized protein n=1 Tax=Melampsora larici-populina (strain 98AG31 / pathotype 3-4-7) TaxID=747676 RepID=F4S223_MELLP|nr:uncharacterized protein MELLADRAFT_111108 [Melampsora larici-populina 98AG31]EGG01338.1 hypothetical protein MELLADRAFT_111108 [Melampsora larici-populina 98AG31]